MKTEGLSVKTSIDSRHFGIICGMEKAATGIYTFENLKPITLIGMAFSTKKRAVSSVKIVKDA